MSNAKSAWSDVFARIRAPYGLFRVKAGHERTVLDHAFTLGLPDASKVEYLMPPVWAVAYFDGAVVELGHYGFGGLPQGVSVIGWKAMRHLCLELSVTPPSRMLKGEQELPSEQQLRDEFSVFLTWSQERLEERAQLALFRETSERLFSVRALLGDSVLPPPNGRPEQDDWPAVGRWGDHQFSRRTARTLEAAGVPVETAVVIRSLVFGDRWYDRMPFGDWHLQRLVAGAEIGAERLREWSDSTIPMPWVEDLVRLGITPDDAASVRKASGLSDYDLLRWLEERTEGQD